MTSDKVLNLYNWFEENGIAVWVCGGWCVDALLGKQTRDHADFDIAIQCKDNANLRKLLENNGYKEIMLNDSSEFMYVMENEAGVRIDIHAFMYDERGKNIRGIEFPFGSLTGKGMINGQELKCISPEWLFKFNTSYEPKEKDIQDMRALSRKFGFKLPSKYAK